MATVMRLKRFGKKKDSHFRIVVCDSRMKRDGDPIEELGIYNPNTDPASASLKRERVLYWLKVGAKPSETVGEILVREGIRGTGGRVVKLSAEKQEKPVPEQAEPESAGA